MPLSFSSVEAVARKPCAVASALAKPMRRSAAFKVFSLIGRKDDWTEGKTSALAGKLVQVAKDRDGR